MAIPIYERQGTMRALPDVAVRYAGDGGQAELWEKGKRLMGQVQAKVEEFEDAETLETFNAFQREVEEYHSDPDKGIYNTRLGKDAAEVAGNADTHIDNLIFKYGGALKTPRARQVFGRMATQVRERRYSANMQYESKQIQAYRDSEADATIQNSLTGIGLNPYDDAAVDAERDRAYMALELKMRGLGGEARVAAMQQLEDQIAVTRVVPMINEDPFAARAWFEENKNSMSAVTQQKVADTLEVYENQEITNGVLAQFGMDEMAGLAYIRENYHGDQQYKLVSDYKQRMNEFQTAANAQASALAKQQKENMEFLYANYYAQGQAVPLEALDSMLTSGQITMEQHLKLKGINSDMADVAKIEREILADPKFHNAQPDEIYGELRRRVGISPEQSQAYFYNLQTGIMSGVATKSDITIAEKRGWISPSDADKLEKLESNYSGEQKKYLNDQRDAFEKELVNLYKSGMTADGIRAARDVFMEKVAALDLADPKYRENVSEIKKQALLESFDANTGRLNSNLKTLQDGYKQSKYDILDNVAVDQLRNIQPTAGSTVVDMANSSLVATIPSTQGVKYQMGEKDIKSGKVDCSGLVCYVQKNMMENVNKSAGYEVFDAEARKKITGASADIVENVSKATGFELKNPNAAKLRAGMIIGIDASGSAGGRGYRGIDHVVQVIQDPQSGKLMIYQSESGSGVYLSDAQIYVQNQIEKGRDYYVVDPMLLAKNPPAATPTVPDRAPLGSRFGGEAPMGSKQSDFAAGIEEPGREAPAPVVKEPGPGLGEMSDFEVTR